ncbi:MAG: suppressor of fused domain protein [Candidatus Melainabacteria bacterium]|nr:suppressor of fused domain protein [Candidatus Melainabacteria bacterium]
MPTNKDQAPGFDAINQALTSFYGHPPDRTFTDNELTGTGSPALDSISVYRSQSEAPHWHYTTLGFSELFDKESENADLSGLGFELTFRLTAPITDNQPPQWPCELLNSVAFVIFESGTHLQQGNHIDLENVFNGGAQARIAAMIFTRDSELESIKTKNGNVEFFQAVAITGDELNAVKRWRGEKFLELAKVQLGSLLIAQPGRESITKDPVIASKVEHGITADGAADITFDCPVAEWIFTYKPSITLGVDVISKLQAALVDGFSSNKGIIIRGAESTIVFRKGKTANFEIENDVLVIEGTVSDAQSFVAQLKPEPSSCCFANLPVGIEVVDGRGGSTHRQ